MNPRILIRSECFASREAILDQMNSSPSRITMSIICSSSGDRLALTPYASQDSTLSLCESVGHRLANSSAVNLGSDKSTESSRVGSTGRWRWLRLVPRENALP